MIDSSVRSLYEKGRGSTYFVSVEQDGTGNGLAIALAVSRAIGATKQGAIASSVREEIAMDLFAEQALWPNIIVLFRWGPEICTVGCLSETHLLREAFSVLKAAAQTRLSAMKCGSLASLNIVGVLKGSRWMSKEPAEIFERAADDGFVTQARGVSNSASDAFIDSWARE